MLSGVIFYWFYSQRSSHSIAYKVRSYEQINNIRLSFSYQVTKAVKGITPLKF